MVGVVCGCAYRAGFTERRLPGGYDLLAVPVFANATPTTGTEVYFTNAMIRELARSGVVRVTERSSAQATLEGEVQNITFAPVSQIKFEPGDASNFLPPGTVLTTAYRVQVVTRVQLRRNSDQSVLWANTFVGERTYSAPLIGTTGLTSANALYNHSARYQAVELLAQDLMAQAHDRLLESNW